LLRNLYIYITPRGNSEEYSKTKINNIIIEFVRYILNRGGPYEEEFIERTG
jgi:hypothetical protein